MKQITKRHFVTAALAICCAAAAFAQQPNTGTNNRPSRVDFLAGYLSLTDAQKTQATEIFNAASTASEALRGQAQAAHDALDAAIKTNPGDAQLDQLAAAVGTVQGQMLAVQAKAEAKFYAILTAEQKAKYDAMKGAGPGGRGNGPNRFGGRRF